MQLLGETDTPRKTRGEFAIGFQDTFQSWDEFDREIKSFFDERHQLFKKRTFTSVLERNKVIAKTASGEMIPLQLDTYARTYKCTHGLKARQKKTLRTSDESDDFDERTPRHVRATGCTATINAVVKRVSSGADGWAITWKAQGGHNHNVSPELFRYYCENRLPKTPDMVAVVKNMHDADANSLQMLLKLRRETGLAITRNDLQNMVAKIKWDKVAGSTVEQRLKSTLDEFVHEEEGNWARVFRNPETSLVQSVVWQSAKMRRWFQAFPKWSWSTAPMARTRTSSSCLVF